MDPGCSPTNLFPDLAAIDFEMVLYVGRNSSVVQPTTAGPVRGFLTVMLAQNGLNASHDFRSLSSVRSSISSKNPQKMVKDVGPV